MAAHTYTVRGLDEETGNEVVLSLPAVDSNAAVAEAEELGLSVLEVVADQPSPVARVVRTLAGLLVVAFFGGLPFVIRTAAPSVPWPFLFLLAELTIGVALLALVATVRLWMPQLGFAELVREQSERHLALVGMITFVLVAAAVVTGLAFALGIL